MIEAMMATEPPNSGGAQTSLIPALRKTKSSRPKNAF
jgi:hypothetical protein